VRLFRRSDSLAKTAERRFPDLKTDATRSFIRVAVAGRVAIVPGEAFQRAYGSPDFVLSRAEATWDDGSPMTNAERDKLVETVLASAAERGLEIEFQ
jgi:Immunity protein 74